MITRAGDDLHLTAGHGEAVGLVVASELYWCGCRVAGPQCLEEHLSVHYEMETFWNNTNVIRLIRITLT